MKEKKRRRWRKLDNAAQAFPAATGKKDTRVFRFYCLLTEDVQEEILNRALERTLEKYPLFLSVLRKGVFWFYLEPRNLKAEVRAEDRPPCSRIYVPDHKKLLFEVSYYGRRINFEVFHALTDGTGAMIFLKELVRNYLTETHPEKCFPELVDDGGLTDSDYEEDSFSQYYTGRKNGEGKKSRPAFQLRGDRLEQSEMEITEMLLSASDVHRKAKNHGVSVTAYLAAVFLFALYKEVPRSRLKRPGTLMIPVNLRNFFPSESMTNFWSWIEASCNFGENTKFPDVIEEMKKTFDKSAIHSEISNRMNSLVRLEKNPFLRAVPLEIKNLFLLAGTTLGGRSVTGVYSNIGQIRMPEEYEPHIERFGFFASTDKIQMCSCSYRDTLVLGLTSKIAGSGVMRNFVQILREEGIDCREVENDFPGYSRKPSRTALTGLRIFSFTCTAAVIICWMLNYLLTPGQWWAGYATAGIFCTWLLIMVGFKKRKNPLKNGMWQLMIVSVGSVLWDVFTGWQGWSADYVIPLAALVNLFSMVIISAVCRLEDAEYLFYLVQAGVCGLIPFILLAAGAADARLPSILCSGISLLFLAGIVIFRWKDLKREVQKKFRV
ncbi:DUF6320 domain-containing protein [Ruminococcus sp. CLA-AA-H200]|uniref:DUF6320 domain-containing protein n=1 Tax=Ruminococcus turbiniformis TaxID=2881258 RepID=A0ABS8FS31_9FIRM|nr:DUF6320 domain-containing protein [Ruminococcus turbiniformis]MCC2252837.1 DUF6320 domain-containing protein [Ruminococcus turbiniformis]